MCRCTPLAVQHYHDRVSGPLRDRLDLTVELAPIPFDTLTGGVAGEPSAAVRARVAAARQRQRDRAAPGVAGLNSRLTPGALERVAVLDQAARSRLATAASRLHLSGRAVHRVLRVARTIADLDRSEDLKLPHLLEALQFRPAGPPQAP